MTNIQQKPTQDNKFEIVTRTGEHYKLDKATVVKYLTDNKDITDPEFNMFFQLCKVNKVNPFLKEAYIIKYGNAPATIVLDYKVLQQIAEENKNYLGMRHGVVVMNREGQVTERLGEYKLPSETLIAGWCEVFRKDRQAPTKVTAMFDEFKATKSNGELNANWANKPCFMICKVAKAQALREAFPNICGSNVYTSDEMEGVIPQKPKVEGNTTVTNALADDEGVIDEEPSKDFPPLE